jgi:hypothetical protein
MFDTFMRLMCNGRVAQPLACLAAVVLLLAGTAHPASAGTVTLDSLLAAGATIQAGDKLFGDFFIQSNLILSGPGAGGQFVDPATIVVQDSTDFAGNFALQFAGAFFVTNSQSAQFELQYTITTTSGDLITDITSQITGAAVGGPNNFSLLAETVGGDPASVVVGAGSPPVLLPTTAVVLLGTPATSITVTSDLLLLSTPGGISAVTDYTQGFSQAQQAVVPEPGSLTLWGLGLAGMIAYGRKRRNRRRSV